ncbi:MAG: response regulator [candidate division NC10 bacterium]
MRDEAAGRILIVDDDRGHREALGRVFTQAGYVVRLAPNGEEALDLLAGGPVDLIISDMRMPRMGGLEFLKHVKLRWPTTQVIILTAFGDFVSYVEAMENWAFQFVSKPVRRAYILALARIAVCKARAAESLLAGGPGNGGSPGVCQR